MQKLTLDGHVHNRIHQKATSYHSYPKDVELEAIIEQIRKFAKAFTLLKVTYVSEPKRLRR